jgi:hypothetical protein
MPVMDPLPDEKAKLVELLSVNPAVLAILSQSME